MLFQKHSAPKQESEEYLPPPSSDINDDVETVVGPSVRVEGDFASEGNIIVKGTVSGSVHTSKHLSVEPGAKIMANVKAGSATISGEVKGSMKIKDALELTSTSRVIGDIDVKDLKVESGAIIYGKISMPGIDPSEKPVRNKLGFKKPDEVSLLENI